MAQGSMNAGGPPPPPPQFGFSEVALLAFATGVVYMAAGAYQIGYQNHFGFTYLSIGVEDLAWTFMRFIIPLTIAVVLVLIFALLFRVVAHFVNVEIEVISIVFFLFPVAAMLALIAFSQYSIFSVVSGELIYLCIAYYAIDPLLWRGLTSRSARVRAALPTIEHSRIGQVIVASMLFVVFVFDSGKRAAAYESEVEVCVDLIPGEPPRILLQRVGDLVICAKVDWEKKWVYADFIYTKIDANKPARFRKMTFDARCIGVLPDAPKCDVTDRSNQGSTPDKSAHSQ